jgi:F-type H+-transporting ATPase subunit b
MKRLSASLLLVLLTAGVPAAAWAEEAPIEKKMGFPQLDASTYASQLVWLAVAFVLLYALMSKIALPRVAKALDMRRAHRDGYLGKAAEMNDAAEEIKTAVEKSLGKAQKSAHETLLSAHQDTSEKVAGVQARFAENSRNRLLAAEQAIMKAKTEALQSLADISADIAVEMVQKVANVEISKADAKKAVLSAMKEAA